MISYLKAENNAADSVGSTDGTTYGGMTYSAGKVGQAFDMDGVDNYLTISNALPLGNTAFSFAVWVNMTNPTADYPVIIVNNGWDGFAMHSYTGTGHPYGTILTGAGSGNVWQDSLISANQWYHLVFTREAGGPQRLYVNGVPILSAGVTGNNVIATSYLGSWDGSGNFFKGNIDEIATWNRSLSASEVQTLYNKSNSGQSYCAVAAPSQPPASTAWTVGNQSAFNEGRYATTYWNSSGFLDLKASERLRDPSMVLLMHFNNNSAIGENATYAVDESGMGNNGTLNGGVTWNSSGKYGGAYQFDGSDDHIKVPNNAVLNLKNFTMEVWVNYQNNGLFDVILAKRESTGPEEYQLAIDANYAPQGAIRFDWDNTYTGTTIIPQNTWTHIAVTFNGTAVKFYVNGILTNTFSANSTTNTTANLYLGTDVHSDRFKGEIDEVTIYNRSLTADEILDHYQYRRGFYQSKVYDAGANASWKNLTWSEAAPYGEELPNNGAVENAAGGANMTGNILLMHFNNNSAIGENATLAVDQSGMGIDGTFYNGVAACGNQVGCPSWVAGKFGNAVSFDGVNDYVSGDIPSLTTSRASIFMWIKTTTNSGERQLIDFEPNYLFFYAPAYGNNGRLDLHVEQQAVSLSDPVNFYDGNWHHVGFTYDGTVRFYFDGRPAGTANNVLITKTLTKFTIGARDLGAYHYFNGSIDEVAVWNRVLSDAEVLGCYKRGALNLKFQTCSKSMPANCTASEFKGPDGTSSGYFENATLSSLTGVVSDNRYFQWKALLETTDAAYTPWLYNVTAGYQ
jgi:hypothetical protein